MKCDDAQSADRVPSRTFTRMHSRPRLACPQGCSISILARDLPPQQHCIIPISKSSRRTSLSLPAGQYRSMSLYSSANGILGKACPSSPSKKFSCTIPSVQKSIYKGVPGSAGLTYAAKRIHLQTRCAVRKKVFCSARRHSCPSTNSIRLYISVRDRLKPIMGAYI